MTSTSLIGLLVALAIASCVPATTEECNDFGLRSESTALMWKFHNFTQPDNGGGCFLCVEIPAMSDPFSRLILPCPSTGVTGIAVSWFRYGMDLFSGSHEIAPLMNNDNCFSSYNSSLDGQYEKGNCSRTTSAIDEHSFEFNVDPQKLNHSFRIRAQGVNNVEGITACIRNITYTHSATTMSDGITRVSLETSPPTPILAYYSTLTSSAGVTSMFPAPGLPIWAVAVIAPIVVLLCVLLKFVLICCKRRSSGAGDKNKQRGISKDTDDEEMVYNPVYVSGSNMKGHPGIPELTSESNEVDRESVSYEGIGDVVKKDGSTDGMIYNDCYEGFNATCDLTSSTHTRQSVGGNDYEDLGGKRNWRISSANGDIAGGDPYPKVKNIRCSLDEALNAVIPVNGKVDKNRKKSKYPQNIDEANHDAKDGDDGSRVDNEKGSKEGEYAVVIPGCAPGDVSDDASGTDNAKVRRSLKKAVNDVAPLNGKVDKSKIKAKDKRTSAFRGQVQ